MKKICIFFIFLISVAGCNKQNQNSLPPIFSASLHINQGNDVKEIKLVSTDSYNFENWIIGKLKKHEKEELKKLPTSPSWCFVFNEEMKEKLMIFCYYPQMSGIALYKDGLANKFDFYPVSETDKHFFKENFNDLATLDF